MEGTSGLPSQTQSTFQSSLGGFLGSQEAMYDLQRPQVNNCSSMQLPHPDFIICGVQYHGTDPPWILREQSEIPWHSTNWVDLSILNRELSPHKTLLSP